MARFHIVGTIPVDKHRLKSAFNSLIDLLFLYTYMEVDLFPAILSFYYLNKL